MAGPDGARGTPQPLQSLGVVKYSHFTSVCLDDKEIGGDSRVTTIRKWTGREASALREAERLSLREFAGRLGVSERVVSKWEARGADIVPRPLSQGILDTRLANASDDVRTRFELFLGIAAPKTVSQWSCGAPADIPGNSLETLRQHMNDTLSRGAITDRTVDDWERTAIRYARATRGRPASILIADLARDLQELNDMLAHPLPSSAQRRLTRVAAQLTGLMCLTLCILDDRPAFRRWARTARLAAGEAGDPETLSWVLAQEAHGHYYSGDVLEAVDVARHAYETSAVPCTGAALGAALEARAQATLGRNEETHDALARAEEALSHLGGDVLIPSAFGYNEASFRFHEGNAYTHLRDVKSAFRAQDRALELCAPENYTDWAMTRLDRAQCLIYTDEIVSGLEYAIDTVTSLDEPKRHGIISLRAHEVMKTLPEKARNLAAARSLSELLIPTSEMNETNSL
jgi:transcriptional regulator with XRE-family HTH domain